MGGILAGIMYRRRHRFRRAKQGPESRELRQQLIRAKRQRSDKLFLRLILFGPLLLLFTFELGRTMFYMQRVRVFSSSLDELSPATVKSRLKEYAADLTSRNPLIRYSAVAALKVATGWNLGKDAAEWKRTWETEAPYWEYRPASATNSISRPAVDWRKELPAIISNTPPGSVEPVP